MSQIRTAELVHTSDAVRIIVGWAAFGALLILHPFLTPPVPTPTLIVALAAILAVIVFCAFGVVKQAELLAHRLGDPYGSLVLTLSIVIIEVVLIAAVMLGPGEHTTIARDSVMAVSMIILNLVIGLALLLGGLRRRGMRVNSTGASAYLAMLIVLSTLAFGLPAVIGEDGAYRPAQSIPVIVLTLGIYAFFLSRQMGAQAEHFMEADDRPAATASHTQIARSPITEVVSAHRRELLTRLVVLVLTMVPIVLLSHDMATLLDDGLSRAGAPVALAGVLIAMIVFLPESITAIRAALGGEAQRVSNLCHGALVSTVGLTIPAVLLIGMATGQTVVLAETPADLMMLGVTLVLSVTTFTAKKVTAMHGATHLVAFAAYAIILFS
ncbi:calcium:proton antiporter [Microbacterium sp. SS28]|uniref:calcium:proton antiporter n=1 Tax=Microbacterium sp. SS28 TaxID=2919948 RepID=UPI001FA9CEE3|nr:calcium:proton antiporter [Microbacterium sp. SS28]